MFGMSLPEIIIIAVIAVIFLGPDKLPDAMVKIAKFFKLFKQTVNSAKSTFEQEVKIAELKEDAKKYKENITNAASSVRKKLTFEELDELKSTVSGTKNSINESLADIKKDLQKSV
ncbi:preprotein translocase subunit TatB, partial [Campylobacter fetus]